MTNEEIIQRGQLINDETEPAQNTSERVGGVIKGIGQNLADKDTAIKAEAARNGYYQCTVSGTTLAVTAPGFTLPAHGGNIRIKMSAPATGASTLNINGTGAKALLYNGAAVSSANTWEQDEIISVFYDPSGSGQYLASNSQGGMKMDDEPKSTSEKAVKSNGVYHTTPTNKEGGNSDLSVIDERGYAIVIFENGHVKTKEFDSRLLPKIGIDDDNLDDFAIADNSGNAIVIFKNGHIKTKKFNSENIQSNDYSKLFQSQINPFGISASRFFLRAGKRAYYQEYAPLIIVAGQSNADGRIIYTSAPSWLSNNNYAIDNFMVWDTTSHTFKTYNVKGMTGNGGATAGADGTGENKYAFDAQFAHDWLAQYGGKLYMVRQTLGGIGIESQPTTGTRNWTWQPDIDNIVSGCNSMCVALMDKVLAAMEYAKQQGIILVPMCILWHQGENDSVEGRVEKYKDNLSNLIMWMRGLFLAPTLPFICGEVNENHSQGYAQINSIFSEIENEDDYMQVVSMAGHYTTLDNVHFDADAIAYMGTQMFNEIQKYI